MWLGPIGSIPIPTCSHCRALHQRMTGLCRCDVTWNDLVFWFASIDEIREYKCCIFVSSSVNKVFEIRTDIDSRESISATRVKLPTVRSSCPLCSLIGSLWTMSTLYLFGNKVHLHRLQYNRLPQRELVFPRIPADHLYWVSSWELSPRGFCKSHKFWSVINNPEAVRGHWDVSSKNIRKEHIIRLRYMVSIWNILI
jgi:hypothetical protein